MKHRLERRYGMGHLHFITCSCYRRKPLLGTARARDLFLTTLNEVRERFDFALLGYVVMPEHIHLLISEPNVGTPTTVMQVLKQRVSRAVHRQHGRRTASEHERSGDEVPAATPGPFWQRRFYDFNVWSREKRNEKMNYMHFNPVKRGLWNVQTTGCGAAPHFIRLERQICARRIRSGSRRRSGERRRYLAHPSEKRRDVAPIEF